MRYANVELEPCSAPVVERSPVDGSYWLTWSEPIALTIVLSEREMRELIARAMNVRLALPW